ncbi:MAG: hypothetical protein H6700_06540 [Myxococcales bacterium]|nr:hypothetical protein [Myxococcales bacterium]
MATLLAAAGSLAVRRWDVHRMPNTETVRRGNIVISHNARPDDAVRPWPLWFADARLGLGQLPVAMAQPLDDWDAYGYRNLWLAYATSHQGSLEASLPTWIADREVLFDEDGYRVERARVVAPSPAVRWDGLTHVPDAFVSQFEPDGRERACDRWLNQSWNCGGYDEWIHVAAEIRGMGDENPYRCIIANAPPNGRTWSIRWGVVPAAGRTLRVRAGNTFESIRSNRGSAVTLRAFVGADEAFSKTFDPNDRTYDSIEVALPDTPTTTLRFEIGADDYFDRFFCFRPQVVGGEDISDDGEASADTVEAEAGVLAEAGAEAADGSAAGAVVGTPRTAEDAPLDGSSVE